MQAPAECERIELLGAAGDVDDSNGDQVLSISVDDLVDKLGWGAYQNRLMFQCGVFWSADAVEVMVMSIALHSIKEQWLLSDYEASFIPLVTFAGLLLGAPTWGIISDRRGRRFGYFLSAVMMGVFGVLSALCPAQKFGFYVFLALRLIVGFAVGGGSAGYALFCELIPSQDRGKKMLTVMGVFWSVGTALSALVGWAILPSIGWRFFFIASAIPSLLLVSLWKQLPESPRYLVLQSRLPEAIDLFKTIAAKNNYPLAPNITILAPQEVGGGVTSGSVVKILGSIRIANWRLHVADWPMLSKTLKLFIIWSINVWGYYGLTFVTPKIARSVSGNESSVYLSILFVTLAELPGLFLVTIACLLSNFAFVCCGFYQCFVAFVVRASHLAAVHVPVLQAMLLVDRLGRCKLQLLLFFCTGISTLCLIGSSFAEGDGDPNSCFGGSNIFPVYISVFLLFVGRGASNACFSATYVATPELYTTNVRATALGVCSSVSRVAGIICSYASGTACTASFVVTSGILAIIGGLLSLSLPETKGKILR